MLALRRFSHIFATVTRLKTASNFPSALRFERSLSNQSNKLVKFVCDDQEYIGKANIGDSLLDVMINNDLPLDGFGACEGTLACCTCHVILEPDHFERVDRVNPASEDELDLLDLAPDLDDHSRLGCQVKVEKEDGEIITVHVPTAKRDVRTLD